MTAPVDDEHRLHRLPARHDQMLEAMTAHGPFSVALGNVARARRDALGVFIESLYALGVSAVIRLQAAT